MIIEPDETDLTIEQEREVKAVGYAYFRHAEGDPIRAMALLRAAAIVMSEAALDQTDPAQALEALIDELRDDALGLIAISQGADETTIPQRKS